jgi:hypothetical protein
MKIDWRNVSHIAAAIVGQIVPGVQMAEDLAWKVGSAKGAEKQDQVVGLVKSTLTAIEAASGRDLANDSDVEQATRRVIDTVVALHQVVAKKAAAAA